MNERSENDKMEGGRKKIEDNKERKEGNDETASTFDQCHEESITQREVKAG